MSPRHSLKSFHRPMSDRNLLGLLANPPRFPSKKKTELGANCADPRGGSWFGRMAEQSPLTDQRGGWSSHWRRTRVVQVQLLCHGQGRHLLLSEELTRKMTITRAGDLIAFKRVARYTIKYPRWFADAHGLYWTVILKCLATQTLLFVLVRISPQLEESRCGVVSL